MHNYVLFIRQDTDVYNVLHFCNVLLKFIFNENRFVKCASWNDLLGQNAAQDYVLL
jgi:hypothetical protein